MPDAPHLREPYARRDEARSRALRDVNPPEADSIKRHPEFIELLIIQDAELHNLAAVHAMERVRLVAELRREMPDWSNGPDNTTEEVT